MPRKQGNHVILTTIPSSKGDKNYKIGIDLQISFNLGHVHFTCACQSFKISGKGGVERKCKHTTHFKSFQGKTNKYNIDNNGLITIDKLFENNFYSINWDNPILPIIFTGIPMIDNALTEIVCPDIFCGHVLHGKFHYNEVHRCPKCQTGFLLQ